MSAVRYRMRCMKSVSEGRLNKRRRKAHQCKSSLDRSIPYADRKEARIASESISKSYTLPPSFFACFPPKEPQHCVECCGYIGRNPAWVKQIQKTYNIWIFFFQNLKFDRNPNAKTWIDREELPIYIYAGGESVKWILSHDLLLSVQLRHAALPVFLLSTGNHPW